jgi:hypothetical protein
MTLDKRRRFVNPSTDVEFFLRDYGDEANEMLLFGRDASGGSVCIRMPHERTLHLLPQQASQRAPTLPSNIAGFVRAEAKQLEYAFPHQGVAGRREWHVITYRARNPHAFSAPPPYEKCMSSTAPIEAFLIARRIKSTRWLQSLGGAQLVPHEEQLTHCHAEYTVTDIAESPNTEQAPAIVVLRIADGACRIEQINSVDGTRIELDCAGDIATMVKLHDPDILHGNSDDLSRSVRFRDRAERIRRPNLDANDDVWHANLVAHACGSPLKSAVAATSVACHFAFLHAMVEHDYLPVLPAARSLRPPAESLKGGLNLDTEPGIYRDRVVQLYDFRSLYPSVVLEHGVDLRDDMHEPLLPALMRQLVDARRSALSLAHAAAFKQCANTLIGCFAQSGGRLYCPSVNQRINALGRTALNHAVAIVRRDQLGIVIAGQTDHCCLHAPATPMTLPSGCSMPSTKIIGTWNWHSLPPGRQCS